MYVQALKHKTQIIKCSETDHMVSNIPVSVVFFYQYQLDQKTLLSGLQQALNDFPLFAGTIKRIDNDLYINCNNNGVSLSVTQHDYPIMEVLQQLFDKTLQMTLFDIIDMKTVISMQTAVLKIKVNYFSDGGMCLGICWHHAIGDMQTFMCFMKAFSNIIAGKNNDEKPLIVEDRLQYLTKQLKKNNNNNPGIRYLKHIDLVKFAFYMFFKAKDKVEQQFYFSKNELQRMKQAFLEKNGSTLSTNDALCAHLFTIITECDPNIRSRYLSIAINYRSHTGMPKNMLGNMVTSINIFCPKQETAINIAKKIRHAVNCFADQHLDYFTNSHLITQNGGIANISRFIPKGLDPIRGTLLVTNWSKFGVYDIDFGHAAPFYFTKKSAIMPWMSSIIEGFSNNGLIFTTNLPSIIANRLVSEKMLAKIHEYRHPSETLPELVTHLKWVH